MRYLDSGSRDPVDALYTWLHFALADAVYFGCQTGYFAYDGLYPLENQLSALLSQAGEMRLVVGANESGVRRVDLEDVLTLCGRADAAAQTSLTLVAANDVLMHPKTFYVQKGDQTIHAYVGSANLTHSGLGRNIEAGLVLDSVNDPHAPYEQIKAAIDKWHSAPHSNAYRVTPASLQELIDDGIVDQPRRAPSPQAPRSKQNRAKIFPVLGAVLKLPRKKRLVSPAAPVMPPPTPQPVPLGTLGTLPNGAVGIIKRLSRLDTKGFNGDSGTLYIALPSGIAASLPMVPSGKNDTPRVDVTVEARIDTVPGEIVQSGSSPTNITHEGAGTSGSSHSDLRFNYLVGIKRGVEEVAAAHGVSAPAEGDLVAIELLDGVRARVTFITEQDQIANLTPLLTTSTQNGGGWGWLAPAVISDWPDDEDDA